MADKKHILTYAGLKQYEDELQNLKVVRRKRSSSEDQRGKESRETFPRTLSTMQQKMSRETSSFVLKSWKNC